METLNCIFSNKDIEQLKNKEITHLKKYFIFNAIVVQVKKQ